MIMFLGYLFLACVIWNTIVDVLIAAEKAREERAMKKHLNNLLSKKYY